MTVAIVQHHEAERPAAILDALTAHGLTAEIIRADLGDAVPATVAGLTGLVALGGPMSATSDDGFPTRTDEVRLLKHAVATQLPTPGVCLGADFYDRFNNPEAETRRLIRRLEHLGHHITLDSAA